MNTKSLERALDCLASVVALRSKWAGASRSQMARGLTDALFDGLLLDLVCVRVEVKDGRGAAEGARTTLDVPASSATAALRAHLGPQPSDWPRKATCHISDECLSVIAVPFDVGEEGGFLLAASKRPDFPTHSEASVVDVSAHELLLALHELQRATRAERGPVDLASLIDLIPIPMAVTIPGGQVEAMNQNALDYFGMTREELKGRKGGLSTKNIHPDDVERVVAEQAAALARYAATGATRYVRSDGGPYPFDVEWRARRFDGVYRWVRSRAYPMMNESGQVVRWCALFIDIDDRRRAEDLVAASERQLRVTVDTIPAMVGVFAPSGELEYVNKENRDYFGAPLERVKDWERGGLTHPEDGLRVVEAFQRAIATGEPFELETRARRFDGVYRWFHSRGRPLRDESGQIIRWYNVLVDIDERKRAEEALSASERDLRCIVDSIPGMVAVFSAAGELEDVNQQVLEYFGATRDELKDWARSESRYSDSREHDAEAFAQSIAQGTPFEWETRARRSDGTHRWFQIRGRPARDAAGTILRWYALLTDIDDLKRAEQALDSARSELSRASRAMSLGVLTASIAHEINQPLFGIINNASTGLRMLSADPPNLDGALETARRTLRDGKRASEIVARLRTLFTKKEFVSEPVDLNEATREVVLLSRAELQRHQISLRVQLGEGLPRVIGDHIQLQQVVLNLLLNASDATKGLEGGLRQIFVETAREGDAVCLAVRDTGVGIPPEAMTKLFEPFFTTKADGMGIGLSVSRSIVERHGGRLWATRNDGPGATFAFSIPGAGTVEGGAAGKMR